MNEPDEDNQQEYHEQELEKAEREMGLPPTETSVELMKYILDPKTKDRFRHLTKDLAVTTFSSNEIQYCSVNLQLMHLLTYIAEITAWDLTDLKDLIDADVKAFAQVTRSKGGFERLAETEKKIRQYQSFEEKKDKRWF
jgi:hypothetical protein